MSILLNINGHYLLLLRVVLDRGLEELWYVEEDADEDHGDQVLQHAPVLGLRQAGAPVVLNKDYSCMDWTSN